MAPVLYLDSYYDMFLDGAKYTDLLQEATDFLIKSDVPGIKEEALLFDQVKEKIFIRLADPKQNQEWLKDKAYQLVDDWACVYCFRVDCPGMADSSIVIKTGYLREWGVSIDEVASVAKENLYREKVSFRSMNEVIKSYVMGDEDEILPKEIEEFISSISPVLYVLKTDRHCYGANILQRKDALSEVGRLFGGDYYILPSSQHEVIVIPIKSSPSFEALQRMVKEITATEVDPEDRLSDELLYYDRERGRVMKAKEYFAEKLGIYVTEMDDDLSQKKKHRDEPER